MRSIPNKLAGVVAILLVFVALGLLPYLHKPAYRSPQFRSLHEVLALTLIGDFLLLTYLGHQPVEAPYVLLGQCATVAFFGLLAAICIAAWVEQWLAVFNKNTISAMLKKPNPAVKLSLTV